MIVEKAFLDKLKEFGLNSYESKLWTALLSRGVSTAGELADISGVPRSRSYDVLESLQNKGFINVKSGKPIKYVAVPPSEALERVKTKLNSEREERLNLLDGLHGGSLVTELSDLHSQGLDLIEPTDLSGSLKGRDNLYHHLSMMLKNAEKSINIMTSSEGLSRKFSELQKDISEAKKRGVKVRLIAPSSKKTKEIQKENSSNIKLSDLKNISRFCVADDKDVMLMLLDDSKVHKSYDCGVWINTPYFAQTLNSMFDSEWKSS